MLYLYSNLSLSMFSIYHSHELFLEIKNSKLNKYNVFLINKLLEEINYLDDEISKLNNQVKDVNEITNEISVNYALLQKYKDLDERLYHIYHFNRIIKIQQLILDKKHINNEILTIDEIKFCHKFKELYDEYCIDLECVDFKNTDLPLDFYVQIIALDDCGTILSGDEFIDIIKNRIYFIKKSDICHLIEKKLVKILN